MKRILVVGSDTIVGGNIALAMARHYDVTGLSKTHLPGIAGVETRTGVPGTAEGIRRELATTTPDLVIYCSWAGESVWSKATTGTSFDPAELNTASLWAEELAGTKTRLIVVSSDAVFHGPWMFHEEGCSGVCHSAQAAAIREMEKDVQRACPQALVLRTNAFGWSPQAGGWLENLLEQIQAGAVLRIPSANYATPIAASCLAELVIQAWDRKLEGVYHVAGSERVNFRHFAHRLAQEFQLPRPRFRSSSETTDPHGFGQGETSLNTSQFRRAVGTSLPMLSESLNQLRNQAETGERDELQSQECLAHAA